MIFHAIECDSFIKYLCYFTKKESMIVFNLIHHCLIHKNFYHWWKQDYKNIHYCLYLRCNNLSSSKASQRNYYTKKNIVKNRYMLMRRKFVF